MPQQALSKMSDLQTAAMGGKIKATTIALPLFSSGIYHTRYT